MLSEGLGDGLAEPVGVVAFAVQDGQQRAGLLAHRFFDQRRLVQLWFPQGLLDLPGQRKYNVDLAGRRAVVVGWSAILGKPAGMLLLARDATVTYCHSHTSDLASIVREADVLVAAVGRPHFIRGEDIKPGAVVVDAGYNPGNISDVDFDTAKTRASLIIPVPGGVGPMTIAVLLAQTVDAAARQPGLEPAGLLPSG